MNSSKKQQTGRNRKIQEKKAWLADYLQNLPMEINLRLLCETIPKELIVGQVLWVESITVTGIDFGTGQKKKFFQKLRFLLCKIFKGKKG